MKILYINTFNPYEEAHGGATVTRGELGLISQIADVTTLFGQPLRSRRKHISFPRLLQDLLQGASLKQASYNVLNRDRSFFEPYDLIFCNHDFSAYNYKTFLALKKPFIVRKLNAEHKLVKASGWASAIERTRIERFERVLGQTASAIIHLSSTEYAEDEYSRNKHHMFPPIALDDVPKDQPLPPFAFNNRPIDILCVTNCEWAPNREGFDWFFAEVAPRLSPGLAIHLVGKGSERYRGQPGVTTYGFVEQISPFYQQAKLFIAPILSGAGIKIKNFEALLRGVPIVSTALGAEGLTDVVAQGGITIADGPASFSRAIHDLLANEGRARDQRLTGHSWATENVLAPDQWKRRLQQIIQGALNP